MSKRMLIDASHPEETRVVVLDGQKVEEFDFEAASKRPLKGNIYLAKVTRVEPSLQAAFVEYGGNRQGFLAFSEIHPDYYQIPVADRMALLAEQEAEARRHAEEDFESFDTVTAPAQASTLPEKIESDAEDNRGATEAREDSSELTTDEDESMTERSRTVPEAEASDETTAAEFAAEDSEDEEHEHVSEDTRQNETSSRTQAAHRPNQRWVRRRHYKIQEVIKRRQVILVQVVKEERGNKGAALTTYLSLAGRYCVLMPNTPRGGGISRKITNANDRKRLKSAAQALELPEGMGLIIRTAGENRTKAEIKRDYEYLLRMWDTIREITLKSNAPACVYEEGDLIKRAIRDLYNKDVSEIVVEGDDGYRNAKDFMRMLMPSHAKNVKQYKEAISLYQRYHIEAQLDAMFSPTVTLKSGGYVVINQTEALVAIDVNSGRATREHSIEDTAYKTNLEAAEEVSRQLRLRDLAGLIVIDFIDMEDGRNDRNVEKRLRDCVKNDRARVQIGKISQFGLLEMSRQRLRAGVVAGSTVTCPTCAGQGIVRSVESTALRVLRALDEEGQRQRANTLVIATPVEVAMYTLNQKRSEIARMERDYGVTISFQPRSDMQAGTFELERVGQRLPEDRERIAAPAAVAAHPPETESDSHGAEEAAAISSESVNAQIAAAQPAAGGSGEGGGRRRRRRRRRGRDRAPNQEMQQQPQPVPGHVDQLSEDMSDDHEEHESEEPPLRQFENTPGSITPGEGGGRRRRRRRRRRGRGTHEGNFTAPGGEAAAGATASVQPRDHDPHGGDAPDHGAETAAASPNAPSAPVWSLFSDGRRDAPQMHDTKDKTEVRDTATSTAAPRPTADETPKIGDTTHSQTDAFENSSEDNSGQTRKGWWQRPFRLRE